MAPKLSQFSDFNQSAERSSVNFMVIRVSSCHTAKVCTQRSRVPNEAEYSLNKQRPPFVGKTTEVQWGGSTFTMLKWMMNNRHIQNVYLIPSVYFA